LPEKISIRIDGEYVAAHQGQTILEVARASGKYIPTLCWLESLTPVGACRLCIVELSGSNRLLPACTTPAQDGMSVTTNSEKLQAYRKIALEFLFSERNHQCAVCVSNNHCELQGMAQRLGVNSVRFSYAFPKLPVDVSHERYVIDHNRCILCTRCVRVCAEVEGAHVWDMGSRGTRSMIVCDTNKPWGESKDCTNCGKCVQVCPTGALAEKGFAVEEMVKRDSRVTRLAARRGGQL
jgi:bidirectional [NiFe] hydrogenase diaphorase subunit